MTEEAQDQEQIDSEAEARRLAAARLGAARTPKKKAAARRRWAASVESGKAMKPGPGRTPKPLSEIRCTCPLAWPGCAPLEDHEHRWDCPRGKAYLRRQRKAEEQKNKETHGDTTGYA